MPTLRDMLCTYEVCHAADVRRPRLSGQCFDHWWLMSLARSFCREEESLRVIRQLVHDAVGFAVLDAELVERFADLVSCGRLVLRELSAPDEYPLPDPNAQRPIPLADLSVDEPREDEVAPRTWISLELVHAVGWSTAQVEVALTTASGRELHGRTDARGRWRSDEVDGRTCAVQLLDHPVLRQRCVKRLGRNRGAGRLPPQHGDIAWPAGSSRRLDLRAAAHHRIVIVPVIEPYGPSL